MGKLRKIWEKRKNTSDNLANEFEKRDINSNQLIDLNFLLVTNKKRSKFVSDFQHLNELYISDSEHYFYKQFETVIFQGSEALVSKYADLIMAKTRWKIVYTEPVENALQYYSTGKELQQTGFWEITPTQVILKVSTYISKVFNSDDLINPQASLEIILEPLINVKQ